MVPWKFSDALHLLALMTRGRAWHQKPCLQAVQSAHHSSLGVYCTPSSCSHCPLSDLLLFYPILLYLFGIQEKANRKYCDTLFLWWYIYSTCLMPCDGELQNPWDNLVSIYHGRRWILTFHRSYRKAQTPYLAWLMSRPPFRYLWEGSGEDTQIWEAALCMKAQKRELRHGEKKTMAEDSQWSSNLY